MWKREKTVQQKNSPRPFGRGLQSALHLTQATPFNLRAGAPSREEEREVSGVHEAVAVDVTGT